MGIYLFAFHAVYFVLFVFVLCLACLMFPVSLDSQFLIVLLVFSKVYYNIKKYVQVISFSYKFMSNIISKQAFQFKVNVQRNLHSLFTGGLCPISIWEGLGFGEWGSETFKCVFRHIFLRLLYRRQRLHTPWAIIISIYVFLLCQ